jgi:hypothetical protein
MTKATLRTVATALSVLVSALLPSRFSHAAVKILSGDHCQCELPYSGPCKRYGGAANNNAAGNISCGMLRSTTTNTNGLTSLTVYVQTGDGGTNKKCAAWSLSSTGSILKSSQINLFSSPNFTQQLNFGATLNVSNGTSSYLVICALAKNGRMISVTYDE